MTPTAPTGGDELGVDRVPVTILTGFLGSGKTTLLNHILTASHGKKIAVIENEYGEVAIDDALLAKHSRFTSDEEIFEVLNGCVCCTVRSDLVAIIEKLASRCKAGELRLDAIIIETTGMADPAPVAQIFLMENAIREFAYLDGIVTLVDAKHIEQRLDEVKPEGTVNEAAAQVGFADRMLLNKMDLISEGDAERVTARLRAINVYAPIQRCTGSDVPVDSVLSIHGFDLQRTLTQLPDFLDPAAAAVPTKHDGSVKSVSLSQSAARHLRKVRGGDLDLFLLMEWLHELLKSRGADIFRIKGVLAVKHADFKYVCQAVHMTLTAAFDEPWGAEEPRSSNLVFIGKGLDEAELAASFNLCLATPENYARKAASLRFAVGEQVAFFGGDEDGWVDATVTRQMVRDEYMPPGMVAPYQVQRKDFPPGWVTWAEKDDDSCIRRKGSAPSASTKGTPTAGAGLHTHTHSGAHDHDHEHGHEHDHHEKAEKERVSSHTHTHDHDEAAKKEEREPVGDAADGVCSSEDQRLRGNQLFGDGEFRDAAMAYSRALEAIGEVSASRRGYASRILANRAACHLKLREATDALADATRAIELDPTYDKAQYRLAHALQAVGKRREAHEAMKTAKDLQAGAATMGSLASPYGGIVSEADTTGAADAADAAAEASGRPQEAVRVAQIIKALIPTLAGSETRRALVEELHTLLSRVSETGDKDLQRATARAFADAKGPQALYEMENSMRGNWYQDAENGTMSRISKIFALPGAVCKAAINHRRCSNDKQAAAMMCCAEGGDCCWAATSNPPPRTPEVAVN